MKTNKTLHITLWVVQIILAGMFLMAGIMKSTTPIAELGQNLPWVNEVSPFLVRFIGISELIGALGLLLPSIFRFKTFLTPLAAFCLFVVMVLAFAFHAMKGENEALGFNAVLALLCLFVAWGRAKKAVISAK